MNKTRVIILITVILMMYFMFFAPSESYTPLQKAYSFGLVDTNPARRVSSYFDQCSPENFSDCQNRQQNGPSPFEGYPLP